MEEYCDNLNDYLRERDIGTKPFGYPKREIVSIIKYLLHECDSAHGKINKTKIVRKMFKYLAKPYCKKFIADEKKFCHVTKQKLIELLIGVSMTQHFNFVSLLFEKLLRCADFIPKEANTLF